MNGTRIDVEIAIQRERSRMEYLMEEADRLLKRRRDVLAEIRRIEQLLGIKPERRWRNGKEDPLWALAYAVLAKAGKPMHLKEILRDVNHSRSRLREKEASRATLSSALRSKRATFVLLYVHTWGLREWAATSEAQANTPVP